ncbi:MAG: hypothetical protein IJ881_04325 [Neisseriaceae bacterium]|nr:hypothetical protein [Neisseriaceae bacterium]MBR3426290.1 hypothetical protein [Neisseriaceae bacterium]
MNESDNTADKASIKRFYEETLILLSSMDREVKNLNGDLTIVQKNLDGWVKHLEEIFSRGVVVQVMQKELEKLIAVRTELEEITKEVKANFQLIAKPQKRWFEFWR